MSNKPPAFQFYAADWLSSPEIMLMTPAEEGAYIRLLAIAWDKGGLPDDDDQLAVLSRLSEGWFNGSSTKLRAQFVNRGNKLINKKQEIIRKTQKEWSKKSRQGGLASAKARQQKALRDKNASTTLQPPLQPPLQPNGNTSTSTSSSSSKRSLKFKKNAILGVLKKDHGTCFRWFLSEFETQNKRDRNTLEVYAKICTVLMEDACFNTWLAETVADIARKKIEYPGKNRMFIKALNNKIEKTNIDQWVVA